MTMNQRFGVAATCVGLLAGAGVIGGCKSAPRGDGGGRISIYETTDADKSSSRASVAALAEFSDKTAESIIAKISSIPEIKNAKTRQIMELGDIYNKTRTPTSDFELIQRRLRGKLIRSSLATNNFKFVESTRRMDREKRRIQGGDNNNLLQENRGTGGTDRYDPRATYVLQGDFLESVRGNRRNYYFEFKLTNLQSREIVFVESFDLGQVRQ